MGAEVRIEVGMIGVGTGLRFRWGFEIRLGVLIFFEFVFGTKFRTDGTFKIRFEIVETGFKFKINKLFPFSMFNLSALFIFPLDFSLFLSALFFIFLTEKFIYSHLLYNL